MFNKWLVRAGGLEPPTYGLGDRRSVHLSYARMVYAAHSASAIRVDGCAITPFLRGRVRPHRYSVLKVLAVARMDATGRYADTAFSFAMPPDAPMQTACHAVRSVPSS